MRFHNVSLPEIEVLLGSLFEVVPGNCLQSGYCAYMKRKQRSTGRGNICDMLSSSSNMPPSCASPLLDSPVGE